MQAWILHGPRDLRLEGRPLDLDDLQPDEIGVETDVTAMSPGTERGNYEGAEHVPGEPYCPRWLGYNNAGTVVTVGGAVTRFKPGDRVFSPQPHQSAFKVKASGIVVKVPEGVPAEGACMLYLYYLGFHALLAGQCFMGEYVAVVGTGLLGLTTISMARAAGARVVALSDSAYRMEFARKVGAHQAWFSDDPELAARIDDFTDGMGIDLVVLAANPWPAYRAALDVARPGGRLSVLSLVGRGADAPHFNPLDPHWLYAKSLTIKTVSANTPAHPYPLMDGSQRFNIVRGCEYVAQLMAEGAIRPADLITHRVPHDRAQEAYEMILDPNSPAVGVVFRWS